MNLKIPSAIIISAALVVLMGCSIATKTPSAASQQNALELIDQGTLWLRTGDFDRAQASFETAWQIGKLAAALDGLGCVAFRKQQPRLAEKYFIQAYQFDQRYSFSLANLALLYKRYGLSQQALQMYKEAISHNPKNFRARNNFGVLLSDIDTTQQASKRELLRAAALKRDPLIESNLRSISEE